MTNGDDLNGSLKTDLKKLVSILSSRAVFIVLVVSLFSMVSIIFSLLAEEKWVADVVVMPVNDVGGGASTSLGSLGGLASLAGVRLGKTGSDDPRPVLLSREFIGGFILDEGLLASLAEPEDESGELDMRVAVKQFLKGVISLEMDERSGIITLSIKWSDPQIAASLANKLVERFDEMKRTDSINTAQNNILFLESQLEATQLVSVQESLVRLMESEYEKIMIASGKPFFSLEVIDKAVPPKLRSEPKRTIIVLATTLVGLVFAVVVVLLQSIFVRGE